MLGPLTKQNFLKAAALVGVAAFIIVYALVDPQSSAFFPKCPFRTLTGFDCPGCGSQRAIHALLQGDIAAAWGFNALLLLMLPLLALLIFASLTQKRFPRLYARVNSSPVILTALALIIIWWIGRNIFL